ncbi:hypothetical protein ACFT1A_24475 [Rhodococcus sp. NPDC057135]
MSVLSDGCADPDTEVHRFLMDALFPARGVTVLTADNWVSSFG